ncbi:unnamed protein product [Laminaria digitata]
MPFKPPVRAIRTVMDLNQFKQSETYKEFMTFIRLCNGAVTGVRASSLQPKPANAGSDTIGLIVRMLQQMESWVDDIPPIDEPMRFGNNAFR